MKLNPFAALLLILFLDAVLLFVFRLINRAIIMSPDASTDVDAHLVYLVELAVFIGLQIFVGYRIVSGNNDGGDENQAD